MDEATFENLAEMMAFPEEELAQMIGRTACCLLASLVLTSRCLCPP